MKTLKHLLSGDGTNYISVKGDEYINMAPVYDWQKIPGTTIIQKPSLPFENEIQKDGLTDFMGAVTDGLYGAVAFDFMLQFHFNFLEILSTKSILNCLHKNVIIKMII